MMKNSSISATNVSVFYGDFQALDHVDFECAAGEFVSIVGQSGTGKSSFLNAVAGLVPFDGQIDVAEQVGYVFQNYALFPWMSVERNIRFGLRGAGRGARDARVQEMLGRIGMQRFAKRYPSQLSGGQVQRVALARALAPRPNILLMDEPYGALDHHTRDRMQSWLLSIWQEERKTVVFVTHYIEEAVYLSDRIVVLRDRQFVADIDVPFERPRDESVRFDQEFLDVKHRVLDCMRSGGDGE